jgi:hypothetical protein
MIPELPGIPDDAPNKRLQRTGISVSLIDNLPHDAVVARPLKRGVRCFRQPRNTCMKRALLKLVAVFEIVSGLAGMYAVVAVLIGMAPAELAPMLWYGIFPLASVFAGVVLWRVSKLAVGLSIVIQSLQIPLIITENFSLNLGAVMKLSFSGIWCAGDECRVRVVLGINFLALVVLIVLLSCKSEVQMKAAESGRLSSI